MEHKAIAQQQVGVAAANIRAETNHQHQCVGRPRDGNWLTHTGADLSGDSETRGNETHFAPHSPGGAVICGRHSGQKQAEVEFIFQIFI